MNNIDVIKAFLETYRVNNRSDNTIQAYSRILNEFDSVIATEFQKLTLFDIDKYKTYKLDRGLAIATQNQAIMCLKVFVSFLYKRRIIERNFSIDIEKIPDTKKVSNRSYMTEEHQRILIRHFMSLSKKKGRTEKRNGVMFLLYLSSGLRKNELLHIKLEDIIKENDDTIILIRGKGNKERYIWLNQIVADALSEFVETFVLRDDDYIFVTAYGNTINPANVNKMFNNMLHTLGLPHYSVHDLRHACASMMFESGATKEDVQLALGHSSVRTTENVYIHYTAPRQMEGFKKSRLFNNMGM